MTTAEIIRKLRKKLKLTQDQFAEKVNTTQPYISNLENNRVDISIKKLNKYCKMLGVEGFAIIFK